MAHITEQELLAAEERMRERQASAPYAVSAYYDQRTSRVIVVLNSGMELGIPPHLAEGISDASEDDLSVIEVSPSGMGLHFPNVDADLYVPGLLEGLMGSKSWMARELGAKGGAVTSPAKAAAARDNGKLGGRPRVPEVRVITTTLKRGVKVRVEHPGKMVARGPSMPKPGTITPQAPKKPRKPVA
ncbi:DUF2442 domain-containing protein [Pseudomonas sp. NPDC090202]|uniref:DUF2442 domain-containing protein n=1 Tax=Pseudomonas sp. NPDC090202 TaxID=3364476 RepID=UPI0037F11011